MVSRSIRDFAGNRATTRVDPLARVNHEANPTPPFHATDASYHVLQFSLVLPPSAPRTSSLPCQKPLELGANTPLHNMGKDLIPMAMGNDHPSKQVVPSEAASLTLFLGTPGTDSEKASSTSIIPTPSVAPCVVISAFLLYESHGFSEGHTKVNSKHTRRRYRTRFQRIVTTGPPIRLVLLSDPIPTPIHVRLSPMMVIFYDGTCQHCR